MAVARGLPEADRATHLWWEAGKQIKQIASFCHRFVPLDTAKVTDEGIRDQHVGGGAGVQPLPRLGFVPGMGASEVRSDYLSRFIFLVAV